MKPSSKLWLANLARFKAREWQVLDVRRATNVDLFAHPSCPQQNSHSHLFYEVKRITSRAVHSHSSPLVNYNEVSTFTEPELEKYGASNISSLLKVTNAWPASSSLFMPLVLGPWRICSETSVFYDLGCLLQSLSISAALIHTDYPNKRKRNGVCHLVDKSVCLKSMWNQNWP